MKSINVPFATYMNLSSAQCPKSEYEIKDMRNSPYVNAIRSVMFSMITTKPNLSYSMANPRKLRWDGLK